MIRPSRLEGTLRLLLLLLLIWRPRRQVCGFLPTGRSLDRRTKGGDRRQYGSLSSTWLLSSSDAEDVVDDTVADDNDVVIAPEVTRDQLQSTQRILAPIFGGESDDTEEYQARRRSARQLTTTQQNDDDNNNNNILSNIPPHELVYGELGLPALVTILDAVGVQPGDEFLDIGSGHGMLPLAAALLYPHHLTASRGLEIVPHLHRRAQQYQQELLEEQQRQRRQRQQLPIMSSTGTGEKKDDQPLSAQPVNHSSSSAETAASFSGGCPIELFLGNIYQPDPEIVNVLQRTTLAVCFATTWSHDNNIAAAGGGRRRQLPKLSKALQKGTLSDDARIVVIDGHLLPQEHGFSYQGELRIHCPDTVPYSTAYLYTYDKNNKNNNNNNNNKTQ